MPSRPKRPCLHPGCPNVVDKGYCDEHKKDTRTYDENRGTAAERGYDARWRKYRIWFLKKHPLCVECEKNGKLRPATEVDHIIPHNGDPDLFWDRDNHQGLCKRHHSQKTAKEDGGFGNKRK